MPLPSSADTAGATRRRLSVRQAHEPFRSRRMRAPSFRYGFIAELQTKAMPCFRAVLGPLLTECPFTQRALHKPFGYAGDYELINMLYRSEIEGDNLFARCLFHHSRIEPAAVATVNRVAYLGAQLREALRQHRQAVVHAASIGSGAGREVWQLLRESPELGARLHLTLIDQDAHALEHCERTVMPLAQQCGARLRFIADPIQQLMRSEDLRHCLGPQHLIYSGGLYDYLDDDTFIELSQALYASLHTRGSLVIGNMGAHSPTRWWMEYAMDWPLIHRSATDLRALAEKITTDAEVVMIDAEPLGLNLFLCIGR